MAEFDLSGELGFRVDGHLVSEVLRAFMDHHADLPADAQVRSIHIAFLKRPGPVDDRGRWEVKAVTDVTVRWDNHA